MATIKDEIVAIATEQGYEGDAPSTIAQAVNALGTVIGGGGSGGGGVIATFSLARDNMSATAGEFLSGEYAGETATNEKIHELATKGVVVVGIDMSSSSYGISNTLYYLSTAQKSGSNFTIYLMSLSLSGSGSSMTATISRVENSSMTADGVSYTITSKSISK